MSTEATLAEDYKRKIVAFSSSEAGYLEKRAFFLDLIRKNDEYYWFIWGRWSNSEFLSSSTNSLVLDGLLSVIEDKSVESIAKYFSFRVKTTEMGC